MLAPIPANRPYRDGERVEVLIDGKWLNGTFRGHASRSVNNHGFIVNVNGGEQYFEQNRVRRPAALPPAVPAPAPTAPPIPPVGLPAENRRALFPPRRREPSAELVAARAAREETRLAAEAARAAVREARAREPANAPMPPPPPAPEGVAYEIHNAFDDFKLNKFMEIIRREIGVNPPSAGILPLFENPDNILYPIIAYTFKQTGLTQQAKEEKIRQLNVIQRTIESYEGFNRNRHKIIEVLKFVMTQPREFIDAYIQTLLTDCLKAYSTGRTQSCIKGMYERIFFSVRDAVATLCLDQMQGTGAAPLCKPSYIELFECFYEVWPKEGLGGLNEMMQEWYGDGEEVSSLSPENRIESFVDFVRRKINNNARFRQAEVSIRKYANEDLNSMFGGKKRRKRSVKKHNKRSSNKKTNKRIKRSKKAMKK